MKDQQEILAKLGIEKLNPMQEETLAAVRSSAEVVLLSPTGSGKTLAFLLPVIEKLDQASDEVQALVLVPSRELALQIEQVLREMGTGFKANAVYGGRAVSQDKLDLKHPPAILIGTPGRVADHIRRQSIGTKSIRYLVLDEFDKSLEVGFEPDMKEIIAALPGLEKKILTSATQQLDIPGFVGLKKPSRLNFLKEDTDQLQLKTVVSETDKMKTLIRLLQDIGPKPGIVFCNFRESIDQVSNALSESGIGHGCFYGGMEQKDRERALIKFRNGTHSLLLATDLAARGIDVPEIDFIIHFHLPLKEHEFTHRNGRTARMNRNGSAFVLKGKNEQLPDFVRQLKPDTYSPPKSKAGFNGTDWQTLFVSGGRRDKISKGDIAGLFIKQGKLKPDQLGLIEVKQDCAFVSVKKSALKELVPLVDNSKLKKKKVRVRQV